MRRLDANRWVRIIEGGVVVGSRSGRSTNWIQVWDPTEVEGEPINVRPELAEFFPEDSKCLKVVPHG